MQLKQNYAKLLVNIKGLRGFIVLQSKVVSIGYTGEYQESYLKSKISCVKGGVGKTSGLSMRKICRIYGIEIHG